MDWLASNTGNGRDDEGGMSSISSLLMGISTDGWPPSVRRMFGLTGSAAGFGANASCHHPSVISNDSIIAPESVRRFLNAMSPTTPMSVGETVIARTRMGKVTLRERRAQVVPPGVCGGAERHVSNVTR